VNESELTAAAERLRDGVAGPAAALSLRLDALMARVSDPDTQRVIGRAAAASGEIETAARAVMAQLLRGEDDPSSVSGRIRALTLDAGGRLGCTPRLVLDGPLDSLDAALGDDLVAVVGEALTNAVRHAYAGTLDVSVVAADGTVTAEVCDDGVGPDDEPTGGTGLAAMAASAERHGGEFLIEPNPPMGTLVRWSVPG
jgi:signal transduction histidine kinase